MKQRDGKEVEVPALAKDSIRLILAALGVLMNDAVENDIIAKNPTKNLSKFYRKAKAKHDEIQPLDKGETLAFLNVALQHAPKLFPCFCWPCIPA